MNGYLLFALIITIFIIIFLVALLLQVKHQLALIKYALEDIKNGNLNRRILSKERDMTKQICYDINEIAMSGQASLIHLMQSERAYKRLMTSLSHDVKTPLASLVGYLEAVESKIVESEEKEEYIRVASNKAKQLKCFVENLFEWVKLNAGEQTFRFEILDFNELSRNIIADWVLTLESNNIEYEFDIPETEHLIRIDVNAYTRIINNLLQNIVTHSEASSLVVHIVCNENQVEIKIADNGKGISPDNLPHIFERMYQCDYSRSSNGNGLGLSIAKELVAAHNGMITANSILGEKTTFTIILPKVL